MNIKTNLAILSGKLSSKLIRLLGRAGTHTPGSLALKIDKRLLYNIDKPDTIIGVTGTNGKTTTSNIIADCLQVYNHKLIHNSLGSNTISGIATTFLDSINSGINKTDKDIGVLELDELWLRMISQDVEFSSLTVNNLFQDSFERNANIYYIFHKINQGIKDGTKLILNASDSISSQLGNETNPKVYFNVEIMDFEKEDKDSKIQDMIYCPNCSQEIVWDFKRYHHIGKFHCPGCGFKNPPADYTAKDVDFKKNELIIDDKGNEIRVALIQDQIETIYNQIAAYATLRENGLSALQVKEAMEGISLVQTRYNEVIAGNKKIIKMIAKGFNPVAHSRVFYTIGQDPNPKTIIYLVDDIEEKYLSERNPGWVFNIDVNYLENNLNKFIVRTKYDGVWQFVAKLDGFNIDKFVMIKNLDGVFEHLDKENKETIYILIDIEDVKQREQEELVEKIKEFLK